MDQEQRRATIPMDWDSSRITEDPTPLVRVHSRQLAEEGEAA
jgi:hypothetical protein